MSIALTIVDTVCYVIKYVTPLVPSLKEQTNGQKEKLYKTWSTDKLAERNLSVQRYTAISIFRIRYNTTTFPASVHTDIFPVMIPLRKLGKPAMYATLVTIYTKYSYIELLI